MYYISLIMKNNILKFVEYSYYFSLLILVILYLFPGSILGYLFYNDLSRQPNLIDNPIGTSINHFFYFVYLTLLCVVLNSQIKRIVTSYIFIFFISIFLEISHFIVPNRAFEFYDLAANITGVLVVILTSRIFK